MFWGGKQHFGDASGTTRGSLNLIFSNENNDYLTIGRLGRGIYRMQEKYL